MRRPDADFDDGASLVPQFTPAQVSELAKLGVTDLQINELSAAVAFINLNLTPPAARNDLKNVLDEVASASDKLLRILKRMTPAIDGSHNEAFRILERGYWADQPEAWDGFFTDHVGTSLTALSRAAKIGAESLPQEATRNRSADWYPLKVIEDLLLLGWLKMHISEEDRDSWMCMAQISAFAGVDGMEEFQLPDHLRPSASPGSAFRRIVGICYEAAGGNPDPERALKAYMKHKRNQIGRPEQNV